MEMSSRKENENYENNYVSYLVKIEEFLIFFTDRIVPYCKDY